MTRNVDKGTPPFEVPPAETEATDDDRRIAANVARLRKGTDMSQTALADAMRSAGQTHWRQNTVSRVETGKQKVTMGELQSLGAILGDVLEGTGLGRTLTGVGAAVAEQSIYRRLDAAEAALTAAMRELRELRDQLEGMG